MLLASLRRSERNVNDSSSNTARSSVGDWAGQEQVGASGDEPIHEESSAVFGGQEETHTEASVPVLPNRATRGVRANKEKKRRESLFLFV